MHEYRDLVAIRVRTGRHETIVHVTQARAFEIVREIMRAAERVTAQPTDGRMGGLDTDK